MKKFYLFLFVFMFATITFSQTYKDVVYLKNGSIIKGIIIEQVPGVSLKIQTTDGNVFVYNIDAIEKMTKELVQSNYDNNYTNYAEEKSPATAFILSALLPGLGQYYNGDVTKGVIQNVLYVAGWVIYFAAGTESYSGYYSGYYNYYSSSTRETDWLWVGLGLASATAIWSMIDALVTANNINDEVRKRKQGFGHMYELNIDNNKVLGLDFSKSKIGVNANFTLHF